MPANTPNRGYTYPLYTEPTMDFPAAIQELATDIDTDVGNLQSFIDGADNRPSMRAVNNLVQNMPTGATTNVAWAGSTVTYDNDSIFNPIFGITLSDQGVYLVETFVTILAPGAGTVFGTSLTMTSSAGFITNPVRASLRAHPTRDTWLAVASLHYTTGAAPDNINVQFWHNQGGNVVVQYRGISATKISNLTGGS